MSGIASSARQSASAGEADAADRGVLRTVGRVVRDRKNAVYKAAGGGLEGHIDRATGARGEYRTAAAGFREVRARLDTRNAQRIRSVIAQCD